MATIKAFLVISATLLFATPVHVRAQSSESSTPAAVAPAPSAPTAGETSPDRPVLQHRNPRYKIQRGDTISIAFPLASEFDQSLTVQPDGYVNPRGTASLYVQGMTVPEAIEAFKKLYSKILHEPLIDLDLTDFQKPMFIVSGQVGKPGQYELRNDITVTEAIAIAGGFTPQAKTQVFLYHRVSSGWVQVRRLNLKEILNGKNVNEDSRMQEGDMVFVPEKFITNFRKYVPYSVGMYLNPASIFP